MRTLAIALAAGITIVAASGQIGGGTGISGRAGASTNPSSTANSGGFGNTTLSQHPIYVSGKVVLSDGAALPEPVKIERVCTTAIRSAAHTDLKGRFNFELGRSLEIGDASDESNAGGIRTSRVTRDRTTLDCELRFSLPGFRTESISLAGDRYLDNPDLGTVILRRIANVEGLTVSATSSLAPKDAKKAYEKGMDAVSKKRLTEAQKDFAQAVELYPRYAAAWYELARLSEQQNQFDDARKNYKQAVVADPKFVPPHERLAWIALKDRNFEDVAEQSDTILSLDPIDYPDAYYLSGVGNFQLGKLDIAEKSAREAVTRDTTHRNPRTSYLLGLILAQKRDFAAAAPLLRAFIEQNPNEPDLPAIRQQLATIEQAAEQAAEQVTGQAGQQATGQPDAAPAR